MIVNVFWDNKPGGGNGGCWRAAIRGNTNPAGKGRTREEAVCAWLEDLNRMLQRQGEEPLTDGDFCWVEVSYWDHHHRHFPIIVA